MPRRKESDPTKKKRKLLDFDDWYAIAKKYYEEHGNLLVPHSYEDEEGHKLGRWIERLRAFYNGKPNVKVAMTQTDIAMLNKIGMVWKISDRFTWPEWLLQCRLYYAANGDLLVPMLYKNEKYALGNWIGEQRKKYKKGTLKAEQIQALEKVGMVWEVVDRDIWQKRYNDAYAYFKEHGNIDVPPSLLTTGNMYLRDWLIAQKSIYQEENCETDLDWERHDLLDDIGTNWERQNGKAVVSYASRVRAYYEEHGNLDIPEDYQDARGVDILPWVKRHWKNYHRPATGKPKSYLKKKKELEKLGFDWSCEGRWNWDPKEAIWLQNYNGVKAYVDEFEKLPIGEASFQLPSSANSECWIDGQRAAIRNGLMNEDKQEMLADIGVLYGQMEANWQEKYEFVKAYIDKHHQIPVGTNSKKMKDGTLTGPWIAGQRARIRSGNLPEDKVQLLADIGIIYGSIEANWNDNYNAVKAYLTEHGKLPVGTRAITLPRGSNSNWWIKHQAQNLRDGKVPEEREKLLNEIGIFNTTQQ